MMDIDKAMDLFNVLSDLLDKLESKVLNQNEKNQILSEAKNVALQLCDGGIGNFDFSSDEAFKSSLAYFLEEM